MLWTVRELYPTRYSGCLDLYGISDRRAGVVIEGEIYISRVAMGDKSVSIESVTLSLDSELSRVCGSE